LRGAANLHNPIMKKRALHDRKFLRVLTGGGGNFLSG